MTARAQRRTCWPGAFVSWCCFCWYFSFVWCNKNVQPISSCVSTSVLLIFVGEPLGGLCSAGPGSPWCYGWITEGAGRQISGGIRVWHRRATAEWARPAGGCAKEQKLGAVPSHVKNNLLFVLESKGMISLDNKKPNRKRKQELYVAASTNCIYWYWMNVCCHGNSSTRDRPVSPWAGYSLLMHRCVEV